MTAPSEEQHTQTRPPGDQGLSLPFVWSHPQLEITPARVQETNQELWEDPAPPSLELHSLQEPLG